MAEETPLPGGVDTVVDGGGGIEVVQGAQAPQRAVAAPVRWPTVYDVASNIKRRDRRRGFRTRKSDPMITLGLRPVPFRNQVGMFMIAPEELASLIIPYAYRTANGWVGYQRPLSEVDVFKKAWKWEDGYQFPPVVVSLDDQGIAYITDGQRRVMAAIVRRLPLKVDIAQRTFEEQRMLFEGQEFAQRISADHRIKTGSDAMSAYVQDAILHPEHPWHDMVGVNANPHVLGPAGMWRLVVAFGCNEAGTVSFARAHEVQGNFRADQADLLARIIRVFGTVDDKFDKASNPSAYKAHALNVMTQAALQIFRRNKNYGPGPTLERWERHMTGFNWASLEALKGQQKAAIQMVLDHWNKKMSTHRATYQVSSHGSGS